MGHSTSTPANATSDPVRIVREDEDARAHDEGRPAQRSWAVEVSLDAGAAGLVQVRLKLRENSLSVRLSSENPGGAATLTAWLPELKAALEQADFTVEELSIAESPAAGRELAMEPHHDWSFTI